MINMHHNIPHRFYSTNASSISKDRHCFAGPAPNSLSEVYKMTGNDTYHGLQSLGGSYSLSMAAISSLKQQTNNGTWSASTLCPRKRPPQPTIVGTWWDSLQETHRGYISLAETPSISQFWQNSVPDLSMLALTVRMTTPANFDPVTGMIPFAASVSTFLPYPNVVPVTLGAFDQVLVGDQRTLLMTSNSTNQVTNSEQPQAKHPPQFFSVTWTVICNGHRASFSSMSAAFAIISCGGPVLPRESWSTRSVLDKLQMAHIALTSS